MVVKASWPYVTTSLMSRETHGLGGFYGVTTRGLPGLRSGSPILGTAILYLGLPPRQVTDITQGGHPHRARYILCKASKMQYIGLRS